MSPASRDASIIALVAGLAWLIIERTETCDRFFEWVAENPDYEVDSVLLAFLLSAIGITIYAWRRYSDMKMADAARVEAQKRVHALAYHDPLTGLPNRRALNERLDQLALRGARDHAALIFVDLDCFKSVNDIHGHIAGDRLLRLASERMNRECAAGATVYRLGGDEFAVVVETSGHEDESPQSVARAIVLKMAQPFDDEGRVHHIGASVGVALFPSDASDPDNLCRAADVALYRAKHQGRGQHRFYETAMDDQTKRRAVLEQEMRAAIKNRDFSPYYQPLVDLLSGQTIGFELLARWDRADGADIGPDQFISIAEETGLINDLMLGLLDKACQEARDWDPALTIAVNISPVQLKDPWLAEKILGALAKNGFAPARLAIEITENAIIADEENARRTIESLKNQGMRVGLDDFGTGYASLHHLRVLPFDKIKIDKSFTSNLTTDAEAMKLVKAIVGLAISLDLPVVAEGIENPEDAEVLRNLGCAQGQGFLFGRPVPGGVVSRVLASTPPPVWTFESEADANVPEKQNKRAAS
jgi:diguanylate cyclase (GGDEF)-like protein